MSGCHGVSVASSPVAPKSKGVLSLDSHVSAGGENLSQGTRQLVSYARGLVRRSKVRSRHVFSLFHPFLVADFSFPPPLSSQLYFLISSMNRPRLLVGSFSPPHLAHAISI